MSAILAWISPLWSRISATFLSWGAIAVAVASVLLLVRRDGGQAEKAKAAIDNASAATAAAKAIITKTKKANDVEASNDALPDDAVRQRLRDRYTRGGSL